MKSGCGCSKNVENRHLCRVRDELIRRNEESRKENNIIFC